MNSFEAIIEIQKQLSNLEHDYWKDNVVFSLNWWFLLMLLIVPWFIWWKFVDKKNIKQILLYGTYIMVVSSTLDDIGIATALWAYPYQLFQVGDRLNSVDLTALPILYMLVYQYFPKWKSFIISSIIFSFFYAFIFEPFFILLGIYRIIKWKYIYSFPIYIIMGIVGKFFVEKIDKVSKSY